MSVLIYIIIFSLGLIIGSFLNCLVWRLHTEESMMDRSHCPRCRHMISWYDNIPVLSWVFLFGKCRHCGERISWQYPVVELVTGVLFLLAFSINLGFRISDFGLGATEFFIFEGIISNPQSAIRILLDWFIISVLIIVFIYDLRWYLILDRVMIPAVLVVLALDLLLYYLGGGLWQSLLNMLISAIIGGSFFLVQYLVSGGKWIGGGDIRLGFFMGLALPWPGILVALMLAYISGAIIGVFLIAIGKKKLGSKLPFGVFLSMATVVSLFWSSEIIDWYLHIL